MKVTTGAISGSYEEMVDAAEDIAEILNAAATNLLDLTPAVERWLVDQLEETERALTRELDTYGRELESQPQPDGHRPRERDAA